MKEKQYLSFGGGINSTALLLLLTEKGEEFEAVFADHKADYPETYEYVDILINKGYPITIIEAKRDGYFLYDYCIKYRIMPSFRQRWCTDHWKARPLNTYFQKPCFSIIGIDAGESHRIKPMHQEHPGVVVDYPLVTAGINREECKGIIRRHGLSLPRKSGCFFCPFQSVSEIRELRHRPDLWCKVMKMEQLTNERRQEQGKKPYSLYRKSLSEMVNEKQNHLFRPYPPCECSL